MRLWSLISEDEAGRVWNENLTSFTDCSPFQSFEWGQYQKALGWQPLHMVCRNGQNKVTAMSLGLLRKFPFRTGFVWCVGGPVGEISEWNDDLRRAILESSGLNHLYFRFRCDRERRTTDALALDRLSWKRTLWKINSSFSMELDLTKTLDSLLIGASTKWRRNMRLAARNDLVIRQSINPDIEELRRVFEELEQSKGLPMLFSGEKLENLFKLGRRNLVFYRCEDLEGNLLGFRGCISNGSRAVDYLAAASLKGRKQRVSFILLWKLLEHCREQGVTKYDLGGIDPSANPGVYEFKKSTGARAVEFLGEWDWATSNWLLWLGNWTIHKRQTGKTFKKAAGNPTVKHKKWSPEKGVQIAK